MKRSHPRTAGLVAQTLLGLAVLFSLIPIPATGQAVTGTILGKVADTSGAVIPGATVTRDTDRDRLHPDPRHRRQGRVHRPLAFPRAPTPSRPR